MTTRRQSLAQWIVDYIDRRVAPGGPNPAFDSIAVDTITGKTNPNSLSLLGSMITDSNVAYLSALNQHVSTTSSVLFDRLNGVTFQRNVSQRDLYVAEDYRASGSGYYNMAVGHSAHKVKYSTVIDNAVAGAQAAIKLANASHTTALGAKAFYNAVNTASNYSTVVGANAGYYSVARTTAFGYNAGRAQTSGGTTAYNVYIGDSCAESGAHTGQRNVFIGSKTVRSALTSAYYNTIVGYSAGSSVAGEDVVISLGAYNDVTPGSSYVLMLGDHLTASVPYRMYIGGANYNTLQLQCTSIGTGLLQSDANKLISASTTVTEQPSFSGGLKTNTIDPNGGSVTTVSNVQFNAGRLTLASGGSELHHYETLTLIGQFTGGPTQTDLSLWIAITRAGRCVTLYIQGASATSSSAKPAGYFTSSVTIPSQFIPNSDIWKAIIVQDKGVWQRGSLRVESLTGSLYIGLGANLGPFGVGDDVNATGFRSIGISWYYV